MERRDLPVNSMTSGAYSTPSTSGTHSVLSQRSYKRALSAKSRLLIAERGQAHDLDSIFSSRSEKEKDSHISTSTDDLFDDAFRDVLLHLDHHDGFRHCLRQGSVDKDALLRDGLVRAVFVHVAHLLALTALRAHKELGASPFFCLRGSQYWRAATVVCRRGAFSTISFNFFQSAMW